MSIFGGGYGMGGGGQRRGGGVRLIIGVVIIIIGAIGYFSKTSINPTTGEKQHVGMTADQETAMGLQAAPEMAAQMGGEENPESRDSRIVEQVGQQLVASSLAKKSPYKYDFHLLADRNTINAFALPGGQVFITRALYDKLQDEAMLAGVLGHEIGHVIGRHSAEHFEKGKFGQMIVSGVAVAGSDRDNPAAAGAIASAVNGLVQMRFSRKDESEADQFGLEIMTEAGLDPRAMVDVMKVLAEAGGGRGKQPEFLVTHPYPEHRIEAIEAWLKANPSKAQQLKRGRPLH